MDKNSRPLIVCVLPSLSDHIEVIRCLLAELDVTLKFYSREGEALAQLESGELRPEMLIMGSSLSRSDAQLTIERFQKASLVSQAARVWMTSATCIDQLQFGNRTEYFFDRLKLTDREQGESLFRRFVSQTLKANQNGYADISHSGASRISKGPSVDFRSE